MRWMSIRFLECIEDCFLLQALNVPTRNTELLNLLLANCEDLVKFLTDGGREYSNSNSVGFRIWLSTLKTSNGTDA